MLEHSDNGRIGNCELEARFRFVPTKRESPTLAGVDIFDFRFAEKTLDAFQGWAAVEESNARDVLGRLPGSNPRQGRFSLTHRPGQRSSNIVKTRLGHVDAVLEKDVAHPASAVISNSNTPGEAHRYGVRFALSTEEELLPSEIAPVMAANVVHLVRYKRRKAYSAPPFRFELTLVWSGKNSSEAEQALVEVIPTSAEIEVEFNPTDSDFREGLRTEAGEDDTMTMAALFISRVTQLIGRAASLVPVDRSIRLG